MYIPQLMKTSGGKAIVSQEQWGDRRTELIELFEQNVFGKTPKEKPEIRFDLMDEGPALGGKAIRKRVHIAYGDGLAIRLRLFVPVADAPAPVFLLICNREEKHIDDTRAFQSEFWPVERIVQAGFAAAAFYYEDLDTDRDDGYVSGVHKVFGGVRKGDSWAAIGAWAWGASRVMDYFCQDPLIDEGRVAVVGHSRGGKTALWCAAQDARFKMAVSNNSGCMGAAVLRGKKGEHIPDIATNFPYWFCPNFAKYVEDENSIPVDQHMLLALIAPRLLYVASAQDDEWADPAAELLGCKLASEAYKLLGKERFALDAAMPPVGGELFTKDMGYHIRSGGHDLTDYDWAQFIRFAQDRL